MGRAIRPLADKGRTLILEPGRFLTAEAGVLVTRVLYHKRSARKELVVVDAGMNDFLRPALYNARHPLVPLRLRKGPTVSFELVGPICESADILGPAQGSLPLPGDLWAVLMVGAYGFSMSSEYNGRPRPAEVVLRNGRAWVVRQRGSYADLVRGIRSF